MIFTLLNYFFPRKNVRSGQVSDISDSSDDDEEKVKYIH